MMARYYFGWRLWVDEEERAERLFQNRRRALARRLLHPMDIPDVEFRQRYRLTKEAVVFLCEELQQHTNLKSSQRTNLETKVLCALFFYANGSYQRIVGVSKHVSQKSTSRFINEVTNALNHVEILKRVIQFPVTVEARNAIKAKFYNKYGVPGVVGCVDGTHIRIVHPRIAVEHQFYCRKHYHSLNVQVICDSEHKILAVNSRYGGATHDAFIWENSLANAYMQRLHQNNEIVWLLGDSGYPLRPWLMTPVQDAPEGSAEARYNKLHGEARVIVENTFGRLKNRWRCILKDRALHYEPSKCAKIITACCVLHNIALNFAVPEPEEIVDLGPGFRRAELQPDRGVQQELVAGRALRNQLIRRIN